jgi:hypothetical protein
MCACTSHANPTRILIQATESPPPSLPVSPPTISAVAAIQKLRCLGFTSARDAVAQLGVWADATRILQLYRRYFPDEFARSTASVTIPRTGGEPGYSEREREFLRLVDEHLFPLPDLAFEMERCSCIPLYPKGIDWDDPPETYCLAIRAVMALFVDQDFPWTNWLPRTLRVETGELDWDKFKHLCQYGNRAVRQFPLLIELVAHDTGNLWLDASFDCDWESFEWEEATMNYLTREWRRARDLIAQINLALERMDAHPRYYLTRLVRLWNRAINRKDVEMKDEKWT